MIKVKAKEEIKYYRNQVLGLPIKEFRKLKNGEWAKIPNELLEKYPELFEEVKDGN